MVTAAVTTVDGKPITTGKLRVINLTPYEGHLEKSMLTLQETGPSLPRVCSLSLSDDLTVTQHSEQAVAVDVLQDR